MGFAVFPDPPKDGVWMHKQTGDLILIEGMWWLFSRNVWFKSRQRKPRGIMDGALFEHFEYLGEL